MAISGGDGSIILTTKVDETGLKKGIGSMGKTAKSFGAGVAKSFAVIGVAAATATVAITKMAVSAYADYEQLVGGVETLFKGSAQKVIDYANDAFYTAGVSANEYMKQVTSFSASLIRSTAGDTYKAADIANMALIDISDNVNKMGSSTESVTLAYQGFAKQQYQLLDNLKLGYGGTKTEMERLLRDAQALTGVKYDINNLADVYSAIHAIQEELGITGTTAKEAEKTITGSANMMKAAWQNVLSAIAGGGDLDRAINNLVYSIQKYFENIVPVVERSLVGIGQLIEQVGPLLVQNVASALIQAIPSLINAIYQMIIGLAKGIWQGIKALFTGGSGSVTADIKTSVGGIATEAGNASTGMEELGDATEKAGKQAKKSLAAFDDLNIISSGAVGTTPEFSIGNIGSANIPTAETTMDIKTEETGEQATWFSEKLNEFAKAFNGIKNINFNKLTKSLKGLLKPLEKLSGNVWDGILWGIENVLVPLSEFTIENVLPNFFDTLSISLDGLSIIIEKTTPIAQQFYNDFLEPISSYAADAFLDLWDNLNLQLTNFVQIVEGSEAWEDLQTILGEIYKFLKPVVKWIAEFVGWIGKFKMNQNWIILQSGFSAIEDRLGLIAALINGDFGDAWEHFKDLMWDNKINLAKESLANLKTAFDDVITKVGEFVEQWATEISNWWENNVKPWFTLEKWEELFSNVVKSVNNFFGGETGFFKSWDLKISEWWENSVAPWFTTEKWKELASGIGDGLSEGFKSALNMAIEVFNFAIDGINGMLKFEWDDIKIAGQTVLKAGSVKLGEIPNIPKLAQGAVIPPNREFLAVLGDNKKENEIVSPVSTMKQAFMDAMIEMGGNFGSGNTEVVLEIDGREFGRAVVEQGNRENRRIGTRLVIA